MALSFKGGSINYHRKVLYVSLLYVLSSCGLFLVQFACSFSRIAVSYTHLTLPTKRIV